MAIRKELLELFVDLEYAIGSSCYNPNSYNGNTGCYGASFRYPVWGVVCEDGEEVDRKFYGKCNNVSPEALCKMKYKFGSNHMYIGEAIDKVVRIIENRYGIDFLVLEEAHSDD